MPRSKNFEHDVVEKFQELITKVEALDTKLFPEEKFKFNTSKIPMRPLTPEEYKKCQQKWSKPND